MSTHQSDAPARRTFLNTIAGGAAALGITSIFNPNRAVAEPLLSPAKENPVDELFSAIPGKHKIVYDVPAPKEIFPFAWPRVFLMTNEMSGTPAKDCGVVVVLRHSAIGFAFNNELWAKYNLGEFFKFDDPKTKTPATRNIFWKPEAGDFKVPGIGPVSIGINELQEAGVIFCVCNAAMTVNAAIIAGAAKKDAATVLYDMNAALLPGVHVVPSGVMAIGRAQEHGCSYCFVGGF